MDNKYIINFYNEVNETLDGDYKIILEPGRDLETDWIEYDTVKWEIEPCMADLVNDLAQNNALTFEEKLLKLYDFICLNYIYDVNVLYFFRKDVTDPENPKYIACDWYGRIVDDKWTEKRKKHNKRICYEFGRFYAKAINTLIKDKNKMEAFMLGDKENTHYVVALTGDDYSAILDLDDFNSVKDLTRIKMGLSLKGIRILRDEKNILKNAIEKYNENKIEEFDEIVNAKKVLGKNGLIEILEIALKKLNEYKIDAQGVFEYTRNIVEEFEVDTEKVWKEEKGAPERRYERCFYFQHEDKTYLLDSIDRTIGVVDIEKFDESLFVFKPEDHEYEYYGG